MTKAPIALFVYNRPDHTIQTLGALRNARLADQSVLYVFADGPKAEADRAERSRIKEVRDVVRSQQWCKDVYLVESNENKGLKKSIVDGVSKVLDFHESLIVLEDDIVISSGFLTYMNEALACYADDEKVMQIAGSVYDANFKEDVGHTFFGRVMQCHGWATWRRAWEHYNDDALDHLTYFQSDPKRALDFDVDGAAYFMKQLQANVTGKLDSWAVRWYASWLRAGGLTLFLRKSLVTNIGFDSSGVNCGTGNSYLAPAVDSLEFTKIEIKENLEARAAIADFWRAHLDRREPKVRGSFLRLMARSVSRPLVPLGRRVTRKVLTTLFPDLKPLLHAQGRISWSGLITSTEDCRISETATLNDPVHLRWTIVGDRSYLGGNAWTNYTEIGKFCSIGPNFKAGWGIHPTDGVSTSPTFYSSHPANGFGLTTESKVVECKKITIGNDVFIGMNVTVLDGVTIGDGAVVGAGCVVSKDVPPYAVVVGSPMKILRFRFNEGLRNKLLTLRWWDWPEEKLPEIEEMFFEADVFLEKQGEVEDLYRSPVLEADV